MMSGICGGQQLQTHGLINLEIQSLKRIAFAKKSAFALEIDKTSSSEISGGNDSSKF